MEQPETGPTRPIMPLEATDAKGNMRKAYTMVEGDVYYGSEEELTEEIVRRREEAKN